MSGWWKRFGVPLATLLVFLVLVACGPSNPVADESTTSSASSGECVGDECPENPENECTGDECGDDSCTGAGCPTGGDCTADSSCDEEVSFAVLEEESCHNGEPQTIGYSDQDILLDPNLGTNGVTVELTYESDFSDPPAPKERVGSGRSAWSGSRVMVRIPLFKPGETLTLVKVKVTANDGAVREFSAAEGNLPFVHQFTVAPLEESECTIVDPANADAPAN